MTLKVGSAAVTSDALGYPYEPHLSPSGRWLLCTQKEYHGAGRAYLYRRGGVSLLYRPVAGETFDEAVLRRYAGRYRLRQADVAILREWHILDFVSWSRGGRLLTVILRSGKRIDGRDVYDWRAVFDVQRERFVSGTGAIGA